MANILQSIKETVRRRPIPAQNRFIDKHRVSVKKHPVSDEKDQHGAAGLKKDKTRDADRKSEAESAMSYESFSDFVTESKEAVELGKKAFHNGTKRSPALDKELGKLIDDNGARRTNQTPYLKAWLKGWDTENLKESVDIIENVKAGNMKMSNGDSVKVSASDATLLNSLLSSLDKKNKAEMSSNMTSSADEFKNLVKFAKEVV